MKHNLYFFQKYLQSEQDICSPEYIHCAIIIPWNRIRDSILGGIERNLFQLRRICIINNSIEFYSRGVMKYEGRLLMWFGRVVIKAGKIIFEKAIVLKTTIFPSKVRFLDFHGFNTHQMLV